MARFEVPGLGADRDLIGWLAKRLAGDGPDSARIRAEVGRTILGQPPDKGGILHALPLTAGSAELCVLAARAQIGPDKREKTGKTAWL